MDIDWNEYYTKTPDDKIPWNKTGKHLFDHLFSRYDIMKGKILDIGCGKGIKVNYLQSLGYDVCGFDISEVAVNKADNLNIFVGDIKNIDRLKQIKNSRFTLILDLLASQFISDRTKYIQLLENLLDNKGYFILSQCYSTPESLSWINNVAKTPEQIKEEFEKFKILDVLNNGDKKKPAITYIMTK